MRNAIILFLLCSTWTYAGVAISLIPSPPANGIANLPGEVVNVAILAQLTAGTPSVPRPGGTTNLIRVRHIQLDFANTNPAFVITPVHHHLGSEFGPIPFWILDSVPICAEDEASCGYYYFIDGSLTGDGVASLTYFGLTSNGQFMNTFNQAAPKTIAEFKVTLPRAPGDYLLDVLNADESDPNRGAQIYWGFGSTSDPIDPTSPLLASNGGITGGQLRFNHLVHPDCNQNGLLDAKEDCNFNAIPDSCETSCSGDICNCVGPFEGDYDGPSQGEVQSSLACFAGPYFKFITSHGPILFQTNAEMNESGVITGTGTKIHVDGQFDFEDCSASGTWSLFGGQTGTWSMQSTRECLPDCNANDVPDSCDIRDSFSPDCNDNTVPDECDLAAGFSYDCNFNEIPDECEDPPVFAISWSEPADGYIDVRQDRSITGQTLQGVDRLRMAFTCEPHDAVSGEPFSTKSFEVTATSGVAPIVFSILDAGLPNTFDIVLSDPIPAGAWTTITANVTSPDGVAIDPAFQSVSLGFLPGDVSGNNRSTASDLLALIDHLNGIHIPPLLQRQCDIDRSGLCSPGDILRLIDLLNGVNTSRPWLGVELPPRP